MSSREPAMRVSRDCAASVQGALERDRTIGMTAVAARDSNATERIRLAFAARA
jgi:hypothetical protein